MRKYIFFLIVILVSAGIFSSCKGLKDSKLAKFYHNVTARFNGYFNGKEKLKEIEARLFETNPDNYNSILHVFAVGDEQIAKSAAPDLDIVIKKASRVIHKHPTSNWVDDSYLLIGKANYYKRDYFAALETLEYLQQRFDNTSPGQEAPLWIIRCYLMMDKLNEAQARISTLNLNKKLTEDIKKQLPLIETEYFIRTHEYQRATEKMELALKYVKGKKYKARYHFILAQLYQNLGNNVKATSHYKTVIKKNPAYELSFQAKIGLADVSTDKKEVERYLTKLTKDDKNIDFNDQIYYVLARAELKDNNTTKAIEYLKQSVATSKQNRNQKALSYLMLADIYFGQPNYPNAKAYYDSAAKMVDKNFPGYETFKTRQELLSELIGNLIIIDREDSLQRLAAMSQPELEAHIQKIIAEEQKKAQQNVLDNNQNNQINPPINSNFNTFSLRENTAEGGYFSNPTALSMGFTEFVTRWGNRPLADDWRRRDKPVANNMNPDNKIDTFITNKQSQDSAQFDKPDLTKNAFLADVPADQQRYYKQIPFTPTQRNISNNNLQEAIFNVGNIYFQRLKEPAKAAEYYEDLLRRFPNTKHLLAARYDLYRIYTELKETAKADAQKKIILTEYPGSDYAQLIQNPDQLREKFANRNKNEALEKLYAETYDAYKNDRCGTVKQNTDEANRFQKNYLKAKFEYLTLICTYRSDTTGILLDSLKSFSRRYPGDEVTKQAVMLIDFLEKGKKNNGKVSVPDSIQSVVIGKPATNYKFDDGLPHYYMMVFPAKENIDIVKTSFSNYNSENYADKKLQVSASILDDKNQILVVKNFINFRATYTYMDGLKNDSRFYPDMNLNSYEVYMISDENYRTLLKTKDLAGYVAFYKLYY